MKGKPICLLMSYQKVKFSRLPSLQQCIHRKCHNFSFTFLLEKKSFAWFVFFGVSWWLGGSSSRCRGVVCSLSLWYFLIVLTYYFRISSHDPHNEKGWHRKTILSGKMLFLCGIAVEDEKHFVMECDSLSTHRNTFLMI